MTDDHSSYIVLTSLVYTSPIAGIASSFDVNRSQYADDTQLFVAISYGNTSGSVSTA